MKTILLFSFAFFLFAAPAFACGTEDGTRGDCAATDESATGGDFDYAAAYTEDLSIRPQGGGADHPFHVEIAATPDEMMRGLMFRKTMPENHGMLFVFAQDADRNFWMKDTVIPLDILFIRSDGTIHSIHENAVPFDETTIPSGGPVRTVLELNGGTAARLGIRPGDTVLHASLGNMVAP